MIILFNYFVSSKYKSCNVFSSQIVNINDSSDFHNMVIYSRILKNEFLLSSFYPLLVNSKQCLEHDHVHVSSEISPSLFSRS